MFDALRVTGSPRAISPVKNGTIKQHTVRT